MGTAVIPKVDTSVEVEDKNGKLVLLGNGGSTFDRCITPYEPLYNSHHMSSHGAIVYDKANNVIGIQCFKVKDDSKGLVIRVSLRTPIEEEFVSLRAIWVMPPMEKVRTRINNQSNAS